MMNLNDNDGYIYILCSAEKKIL